MLCGPCWLQIPQNPNKHQGHPTSPVQGALMVHHDVRFEGTESPPARSFRMRLLWPTWDTFVFVIPRQSKKVLRYFTDLVEGWQSKKGSLNFPTGTSCTKNMNVTILFGSLYEVAEEALWKNTTKASKSLNGTCSILSFTCLKSLKLDILSIALGEAGREVIFRRDTP